MNKKEAELLANHIARWSADDQVKNHNAGLIPQLKQIGNNSWVVYLQGKTWYVWSWQEWQQDFEHDLVLAPKPEEEEGIEA